MNRALILLVLIFSFSFNSYSQWEYVGDPDGISEYELILGVIKFQLNSGDAYVFYQNSTVNVASEYSMQKFNGNTWEYVGDQTIDQLITTNHHIDFAFDPLNANVPIIYYHPGVTGVPTVAKLSGSTWEPLLGLTNFSIALGSSLTTAPISIHTNFGFDVGPNGNPVLGFQDLECMNIGFGNPPGNMSVVSHNGSQWEYLGQACLSARSAGNVDLEYSPVTNELFGYHKGGEEESTFDQFRVLEKLNGAQWDNLVSPPDFDLPNVVGHMRVNPVTGNVFIYDRAYEDGLGSDRQFKVYEWDGMTLDSIHANNDLDIGNDNWLVDFHPTTGEMHVLFTEGGTLNIKKHDGTGWVTTPFSDISEFPSQVTDYVDMRFHPNGDLYILKGRGTLARIIKRNGPVVNGTAGCTDSLACNYNLLAMVDDGSCGTMDSCYSCNGGVLQLIDNDNNGICDALGVAGCTDLLACNYNSLAMVDDGSCTAIPDSCHVCNGATLQFIDIDNNGVCDAVQVVGINEITNAPSIKVYPNPATDKLNILVSENANIQLLNLFGQEVVTEEGIVGGKNKQLTIAHLAEGVYFLKIATKNFVSVTRVVINK